MRPSVEPRRYRLFAILRPERCVPVVGAFDHGDRPFGADAGGFAGGTDQSPAQEPQWTAGTDGQRHDQRGHVDRQYRHCAQHGVGRGGDLLAVGDGSLTMTPGASYSGYSLERDERLDAARHDGHELQRTLRARRQQTVEQAVNFSVNPRSPTDSTSSPSRSLRSPLDGGGRHRRGVGRCERASGAAECEQHAAAFPAAGGLNGQTTSLGNYADASIRTSRRRRRPSANSTAAGDQLTEAQTASVAVSGVNLDEELSNMVLLSAGL